MKLNNDHRELNALVRDLRTNGYEYRSGPDEIRNFIAQEYWTIAALLGEIEANLYKLDGKVLEKFDIPSEAKAKEITIELEKQN